MNVNVNVNAIRQVLTGFVNSQYFAGGVKANQFTAKVACAVQNRCPKDE